MGGLREKVVLEKYKELVERWGRKGLRGGNLGGGKRRLLHLGVGMLLVGAGVKGRAMSANEEKSNPPI